MRAMVTVVRPEAGQCADVVIDADPATPVGAIAAELDRLPRPGRVASAMRGAPPVLTIPPAPKAAAHAGPGIPGYGSAGWAAMASGFPAARPAASAVPPLFVNGELVAPRLPLRESAIRDGAIVGMGAPARTARAELAGVAQLRVAGGPDAGRVFSLPFGDADIGGPGSGPSEVARIVIGDSSIPPTAFRLLVDTAGFEVVPYDGAGVLLDRQPLDGPTLWRPGQQIAVGVTLLEISPWEPPDAALRKADDDTGLEFNRPPRLLPPGQPATFTLPVPPSRPDRHPAPILMAVVPVLLGVGMAYFLRQVYMLAMAAFSPVMLLGSYVSDRRHGRKSWAYQLAEYRRHRARVEHDAHAAAEAERLRRRRDCPDPGAVLAIATGPRRRLWERRRTDPDYLSRRWFGNHFSRTYRSKFCWPRTRAVPRPSRTFDSASCQASSDSALVANVPADRRMPRASWYTAVYRGFPALPILLLVWPKGGTSQP